MKYWHCKQNIQCWRWLF